MQTCVRLGSLPVGVRNWQKEGWCEVLEVGKRLKLSQPGASRAAQNGAELAKKRGWSLQELLSGCVSHRVIQLP
jgi:hypothetical protein